MKSCDTCKHFLYNGDMTVNAVDYEAVDGKKLNGPVPIGTCNAPVPPWAQTFVAIAGAEVARVQANTTNCRVHEPA